VVLIFTVAQIDVEVDFTLINERTEKVFNQCTVEIFDSLSGIFDVVDKIGAT